MKYFLYSLVVLSLLSCTKKSELSAPALSEAQVAERGKSIYNLNCIACHNPDPAKDGSTGPALLGASKELLAERLLRAGYPANYKPKRDTKQMPALPHLEKELDALAAFLNPK